MVDARFWHQKWENNDIAFHKNVANPLLIKHFDELSLEKESRIFLPLCGKTLDIGWLLSNGYSVAGAELSEIAIKQLFAELDIKPQIVKTEDIKRYSAKDIDIFVGDIFRLSNQMLGAVDAIYDRAALIALPEAVRNQYTAHLKMLTNNAPQLLICCEYDQTLMEGPPFSISDAEINRHYKDSYALTLLECEEVLGGLKGKCAATEKVWLLKKALS
jgi:thiopurine S-methyltransferase